MKTNVTSALQVDSAISVVNDKLVISYAYGEVPTAKEDYARLHLFKHSVLENEFGPGGKVWMAKKGPFTFISQPLPSGSSLVIKYGYAVHQHRAWIAINPAKMTADDFEQLEYYLILLFTEGGKALWGHGKVQRIDMAIGVAGASFHDFLFVDRRLRLGNALFQSLGTTYLGSKDGNRTLACYDKAAEILAKTGKVVPPMLRIEARLQPAIKISQFGQLANPFLSLVVVPCNQLHDGPPCLQAFAERVALGMPADLAYRSCHPQTRAKLWQELRLRKVAWWDPELIWKSKVLDGQLDTF